MNTLIVYFNSSEKTELRGEIRRQERVKWGLSPHDLMESAVARASSHSPHSPVAGRVLETPPSPFPPHEGKIGNVDTMVTQLVPSFSLILVSSGLWLGPHLLACPSWLSSLWLAVVGQICPA